ncbi:MAG: hypothetical protein WBB23_10440, partial [Desulforhopalus sp.]
MKNILTYLSILLLSITLLCSTSTAQKTRSGKDNEVVTTYVKAVDLIQVGNFQELEEIINKIADSKVLTADGRRKLEELYTELMEMDEVLLDRWITGTPNSAHPYIVRGKFNLRSAQQKLIEAGQYTFRQPKGDIKLLLRKAQADLEKAGQLDPTNAAPPSELVAIAMYRGYPSHLMNQWFSDAVEADPFWLGSYRNKL